MEGIYISLLSGLFATILSIIVTLLINVFFQRKFEEKSFDETRMKLNALALNEPFLRSDDSLKESFTADERENAIKRKKYDLMCIMVCNYLKSLCEFYRYNPRKFAKRYNFKQNIDCLTGWWRENHAKNLVRYDEKFVKFIDDFIGYKLSE